MRCMIAAVIMVLLAGSALAVSNSPVQNGPAPYHMVVPGARTQNIVVYTDDCYGYDYVLDALAAEGLAYTLYYADYAGFEAAVASGLYDMILVNHECYFECSYTWDTLINAYNAGASMAVFTFDWDGSNDYSGRVRDLLALGLHTFAFDVQTQGPVYVWNADPIFTGLPATIPPAMPDIYFDEGDSWSYETAESGWTPTPSQPYASCNIGCGLVLGGFTMDELSQDHAVRIWRNIIHYLQLEPSATRSASWSSLKTLFR